MIKVNCVVNSVDAGDKKALSNERQIVVDSLDDNFGYDEILITLGENKIVIRGDDLIAAIENCKSKGQLRHYFSLRRDGNRYNNEEE